MRNLLKPPRDRTEPDVQWPPTRLDVEPEICYCLPHGEELPCRVCEAFVSTATGKEPA